MNDTDLKKAGLKATAPRIKILQLLESNRDHHLSAEEVYRSLLVSGDDISLATVYRVLTQFEKARLVIRHNFEGGYSVFELDDRPHHDHLVCIKCGHVEEFADVIIEKRQQDIAKKIDFTITGHSLNIYGICERCR